MEPTRKLRWERPGGIVPEPPPPEPHAIKPHTTKPHLPDPLTSLVRLVRTPSGGREAPPPVSHEDWAGLIDRVRTAASRAREAESHALDREQQMQDLVRHVRAEAEAAEDRVRAAEMRAAAAELRAEQAEARARTAEDWLLRIHETIASEFGDLAREEAR